MTRHILDKPRSRDEGARAKAYARIERETGDAETDPRVKALHRTRPAAKSLTRTKAYRKIEKGIRA